MNMLKFASWLPIQARLDQAKAFARNVASRHDVPTKVQAYDEDGNPEVEIKHDDKGKLTMVPVMVPIASDLRDVQGRWWGTKEGRSLASVLLISETLEGSQSAIAPVLMGLITFLTVIATTALTFMLTADGAGAAEWVSGVAKVVAYASGIGMLVLFTALWSAVGAQGNRMVLLGSVLIPAFGLLLTYAINRMAGVAELVTGSGGDGSVLGLMAKYAMPVAGLAFVAFLFLGKRDTTKQMLMDLFKVAMFLLITSTIASLILPDWMEPLYWAWLGCAVPVWWNRKQEELRAIQLLYQSKIGMGDLKALGNTSAEKRLRQAESAEKDKSGFIPLGRARGVLTGYGDGYAPDAGLLLGLTCHELRTHFHGFGKTGGGKTFNLFTPIIQWWARHGHGGVLVLDGKGAAGDELLAAFIAKHGLQHRALLIKPGIPLGLMEGLEPGEFIDAIFDVGGAAKQEVDQANAEFFLTQGRKFGLSLAWILHSLVAIERSNPARSHRWTIDSFDRLKAALKQPSAFGKSILDNIKLLPAHRDNQLVRDAVIYIELNLWTQPADQAGGIVSTLDNGLMDLMADPELRVWASQETGVDVTIPTTGGFVAVSLPEVKYGKAGKLVQSLIKQRLLVKVRRRGDYNWRAAGETPVLFAVDEAQELISQADRNFLPQSRGLGGYAAYFSQSVDAYESRMGDAATRAFLDNFRSRASFEASSKTYEYLAAEMGRGKFMTWNSPSQVINFMATAQTVASSPLHDSTRDDAKFMRKLRRRGAGRVVVPIARKASAGQGLDVETRMATRSYHDPAEIHDSTAEQFIYHATVSGEIKDRPLLMLEDCAKHLNSEQDAIVSYRRAGSRRHDFVSFDELTPEQVKENERQFHRALLFNAAVHTLQRDLAQALGERPSAGPLRRLTQALIHLLLTDQAFADRYQNGELLVEQVKAQLEDSWTVDRATRQAWREQAAKERETFIDRYLADMEQQKLAA